MEVLAIREDISCRGFPWKLC